MMRRIAFLVFPNFQALDLAGPLDVFAEANGLVPAEDRYEIAVIGPTPDILQASNGMQLVPDVCVEAARDHYETMLVVGGPDVPTSSPDVRLVSYLCEQAAHVRRYGSICTGAFYLGAAGLLNGKKATTHWQAAPLLAKKFPHASVDPDPLFIYDEPLITSAGVTAGIDLALALVQQDFGSGISLAVARKLIVVAHRLGGQLQYSPSLVVSKSGNEKIERFKAHVERNIRDELSNAALARALGISFRHLSRLVQDEMGITPIEYIRRARLDTAREVLANTKLPLKVVAHESGFGTVEKLSRAFKTRFGVTPIQYRSSFGS